jgi:hypothetical protein
MNEALQNFRKKALAVGLLATAATAAGFFLVERSQFFQSYLIAFLYVLAFAGGSLGLLMIHHLAGGRWSFCLQRPLEAATRTFPLLLVLFIPILFGMDQLYAWMRPEAGGDHVLQHVMHQKGIYLNVTGFYIRAALYFAVWIGLATLLSAWSRQQDEDPGQAGALDLRMRKLSGIGLVIFGLATTFASFDWAMSIEPKWYSTIYGALFMVGQGVATLSLMAFTARGLSRDPQYGKVITPQQFHDVGNLMFAFTILWAYMSIGQYIIIWSGNLPEEIEYYLHRSHGVWPWLSIGLAVFHFAVPFFLMLLKANKKRSHVLVRIAALLLVMRLVDLFWLITPAFRHDHFHVHWLDVVAPLGLFGLWLYAFLGQLVRRPFLPRNDPRFVAILGHPEEHDVGWEADASDA